METRQKDQREQRITNPYYGYNTHTYSLRPLPPSFVRIAFANHSLCRVCRFLEYIAGGCQISLIIAIGTALPITSPLREKVLLGGANSLCPLLTRLARSKISRHQTAVQRIPHHSTISTPVAYVDLLPLYPPTHQPTIRSFIMATHTEEAKRVRGGHHISGTDPIRLRQRQAISGTARAAPAHQSNAGITFVCWSHR